MPTRSIWCTAPLDPEIGAVPAVHPQRLQGRGGVAGRRRQAGHQRLQHLAHASAGLGRDQQRVAGIQADHVGDLRLDALRLGRRQVDLVQHRHDLVAGLDRVVGVGQRLRLHSLGRVDHQQRALAGGERAADLVGEVDMAGGVHEVQLVGLAVLGGVTEAHGLGLDGDAALALQLHRIEHLFAHLALGQAAAGLDQPVGQGRLAVVDMGDDREVADVRQVGHGREHRGGDAAAQCAGRDARGSAPDGDGTKNARPDRRRADDRRDYFRTAGRPAAAPSSPRRPGDAVEGMVETVCAQRRRTDGAHSCDAQPADRRRPGIGSAVPARASRWPRPVTGPAS
jgi:hypothetical protein